MLDKDKNEEEKRDKIYDEETIKINNNSIINFENTNKNTVQLQENIENTFIKNFGAFILSKTEEENKKEEKEKTKSQSIISNSEIITTNTQIENTSSNQKEIYKRTNTDISNLTSTTNNIIINKTVVNRSSIINQNNLVNVNLNRSVNIFSSQNVNVLNKVNLNKTEVNYSQYNNTIAYQRLNESVSYEGTVRKSDNILLADSRKSSTIYKKDMPFDFGNIVANDYESRSSIQNFDNLNKNTESSFKNKKK